MVVDYDCPNRTKDWVAAHFPEVKVAAVINEPFFNLSRARNVGASLATAPWLVFCDADQLLAPAFASELWNRLVPGTYLRTWKNTLAGPRWSPHPLICEASAFWAVGGYDDAFRGWGPEDLEFLDRLQRIGTRGTFLPAELVETLRHSDAARGRFYEHSIEVSAGINHYYAKIKRRYFETAGRWFTDEQRYLTHREVERAVLAALEEPDSDAVFDIPISASVPPWTARLTALEVRHSIKALAKERAQILEKWGKKGGTQ